MRNDKIMILGLLILLISVSANAKDYVFFLHNKYVELFPLDRPHREFGLCEYNEILEAFGLKGL